MRILIIEDDALAVRMLRHSLGDAHLVTHAESIASAKKMLGSHWDLVLLDLNLHERLDGMTLIQEIKKYDIPCVVMSAHEEDAIIDQCYELGCDLYYGKGDLNSSIAQVVFDLTVRRNEGLREQVFTQDWITQDTETKTAVRSLFTALKSGAHCLITGPTGAGKTELAKVLHRHLGCTGPLVELNCAGISKELFESELFGHEKGAFTGADKTKMGKARLADQGVLFLDEIGCLPLEQQSKLLKLIEEKRFFPVGSDKEVSSQFKLIAATNEDLFSLVTKGLFRADLLQRLCGSVMNLKGLADRSQDIIPLLQKFNQSARKISFSEEAKKFLMTYSWPGNIRELKNLSESLLQLPSGRVSEADLKKLLRPTPAQHTELNQDLVEEALRFGLDELTNKIKSSIIDQVLKRNHGNATKTMKDLSISSRQYYNLNPAQRMQ